MTLYNVDGQSILQDENSCFKNKKMVCFGDSLTEVNAQYTKGWHEWVSDILDLSSYTNEGVSSATSSGVLSQINNYTPTGENIVTVMHGSNDTGIADSTEQNNIKAICEAAKTKFPTAIIIYITPHYQTKYQVGTNTTQNIRSDVLEIAPLYSIAVYDNYQFMGLYESNLSILTNDNCHWNDKGHEVVGKNLAKWILTNFRYVY